MSFNSEKKRVAHIGNLQNTCLEGESKLPADDYVFSILESMTDTLSYSAKKVVTYQQLEEFRSGNKQPVADKNSEPSTSSIGQHDSSSNTRQRKILPPKIYPLMAKCQKNLKYLKHNRCIPKPRAHMGYFPPSVREKNPEKPPEILRNNQNSFQDEILNNISNRVKRTKSKPPKVKIKANHAQSEFDKTTTIQDSNIEPQNEGKSNRSLPNKKKSDLDSEDEFEKFIQRCHPPQKRKKQILDFSSDSSNSSMFDKKNRRVKMSKKSKSSKKNDDKTTSSKIDRSANKSDGLYKPQATMVEDKTKKTISPSVSSKRTKKHSLKLQNNIPDSSDESSDDYSTNNFNDFCCDDSSDSSSSNVKEASEIVNLKRVSPVPDDNVKKPSSLFDSIRVESSLSCDNSVSAIRSKPNPIENIALVPCSVFLNRDSVNEEINIRNSLKNTCVDEDSNNEKLTHDPKQNSPKHITMHTSNQTLTQESSSDKVMASLNANSSVPSSIGTKNTSSEGSQSESDDCMVLDDPNGSGDKSLCLQKFESSHLPPLENSLSESKSVCHNLNAVEESNNSSNSGFVFNVKILSVHSLTDANSVFTSDSDKIINESNTGMAEVIYKSDGSTEAIGLEFIKKEPKESMQTKQSVSSDQCLQTIDSSHAIKKENTSLTYNVCNFTNSNVCRDNVAVVNEQFSSQTSKDLVNDSNENCNQDPESLSLSTGKNKTVEIDTVDTDSDSDDCMIIDDETPLGSSLQASSDQSSKVNCISTSDKNLTVKMELVENQSEINATATSVTDSMSKSVSSIKSNDCIIILDEFPPPTINFDDIHCEKDGPCISDKGNASKVELVKNVCEPKVIKNVNDGNLNRNMSLIEPEDCIIIDDDESPCTIDDSVSSKDSETPPTMNASDSANISDKNLTENVKLIESLSKPSAVTEVINDNSLGQNKIMNSAESIFIDVSSFPKDNSIHAKAQCKKSGDSENILNKNLNEPNAETNLNDDGLGKSKSVIKFDDCITIDDDEFSSPAVNSVPINNAQTTKESSISSNQGNVELKPNKKLDEPSVKSAPGTNFFHSASTMDCIIIDDSEIPTATVGSNCDKSKTDQIVHSKHNIGSTVIKHEINGKALENLTEKNMTIDITSQTLLPGKNISRSKHENLRVSQMVNFFKTLKTYLTGMNNTNSGDSASTAETINSNNLSNEKDETKLHKNSLQCGNVNVEGPTDVSVPKTNVVKTNSKNSISKSSDSLEKYLTGMNVTNSCNSASTAVAINSNNLSNEKDKTNLQKNDLQCGNVNSEGPIDVPVPITTAVKTNSKNYISKPSDSLEVINENKSYIELVSNSSINLKSVAECDSKVCVKIEKQCSMGISGTADIFNAIKEKKLARKTSELYSLEKKPLPFYPKTQISRNSSNHSPAYEKQKLDLLKSINISCDLNNAHIHKLSSSDNIKQEISIENTSEELNIIAATAIQDLNDKKQTNVLHLLDLYKEEYKKYQEIQCTERNLSEGLYMLREKQVEKLKHIMSSIKNSAKYDPCFYKSAKDVELAHSMQSSRQLEDKDCFQTPGQSCCSDVIKTKLSTETSTEDALLKDCKIFNSSVFKSAQTAVASSHSPDVRDKEVYERLMNSKCAYCGKPAKAACQGCLKVYYCSAECGVISWNKGHYASCEI